MYKSTLGKMLFLGRMTQPIMLRVVSHMATKTAQLKVHHLKDLEAQIRYLKRTLPCIAFPSVPPGAPFHLDVYTDASMAGKKRRRGTRGVL